MKSLEKNRKLTSEHPHDDAAAKAGELCGNQCMLFKLQQEDPIRYQRVNILNLDKLTALESIGAASNRQPSRKCFHASTVTPNDFSRIITRPIFLRSERSCTTTHSLSAHHEYHVPSDSMTHQFCCAAISFRYCCLPEIEDPGWKQSNPWLREL